ncbi:MAG: DUF4105 domain-containing protein [Gemmatimonadetes bacterium]|nr:DUF4105 domain-containing protein [Gemmatimonadota bacterium]
MIALRIAVAGLALAAAAAGAQRAPAAGNPSPGAAVPATSLGAAAPGTSPGAGGSADSSVTVDLLTIGQGDFVFEKFGHNAIVITDRVARTSVAYNWGVFDFNQPNFLGRFLTGDTKYWVAAFDTRASIEYYKQSNRTLELQRLALTPAQVLALRNLAERNLLEENKYYRYDYFRDNCSTRVRDLLDQVLGGALRRATEGTPGTGSFRTHVQRLIAESPATYAGITIALGRRADSTLSQWDEMFIPMKVRDRVRELRVMGPEGKLVPLVAVEQVLFTATREPERAAPPQWTGYFFAIGALLAALVLAAARTAPASGGARLALRLAGTGWGLLAGCIGVVLLLAATVTRHVYWQQDVSLALLPPTGLLFAPLWWRWLGKHRPGLPTTIGLAAFLLPPVFGTAAAFLDGGWHGALPVIALTLPVHAAFVAAITLVAAREPARALRFKAA